MAKDARLHIRIDEDLKEELRKRADKENRNLSNYVLTTLKKEVEKDKKIQKNT